MYDIDFDDIAQKIEAKGAKRVLIQLPEGLKHKAIGIAEKLRQKTGAEMMVNVDPCFGACDLADEKALALNADLLIHFGHSEMYRPKLPTLFIPLQGKLPESLANDLVLALNKAQVSRIGLCATIQYVDYLQSLGESLEKNNFEVFLGEGSERIKEIGQVLGCNYSCVKAIEEDVEAIVFLGDGLFHPLGISFVSKKPVFLANPLEGMVKELKAEKDLFLRQRFAVLSQCANAQKFGVIVSTKKGQRNLGQALAVKGMIEGVGKKAFILAADYVFPDYFLGLDVDCFVSTACPRIAIDDSKQFNKLIINPTELEIALNRKKLSGFRLDELE